MSTIRISITDEIQKFLEELRKKKFYFLENPEIIRAILSEYYSQFKEEERAEWIESLPTLLLNEKEQASLAKGIQDSEKGNSQKMTIEEIMEVTDPQCTN